MSGTVRHAFEGVAIVDPGDILGITGLAQEMGLLRELLGGATICSVSNILQEGEDPMFGSRLKKRKARGATEAVDYYNFDPSISYTTNVNLVNIAAITDDHGGPTRHLDQNASGDEHWKW